MKHWLPRLLVLVIALASIQLRATPAEAAGTNLGWASSIAVNDCPSSGASTANHNSLCTSNASGTNLIGSVIAPAGLLKVVGQSVIVDYQENAATLSDWWLFDTGSCRGASALSLGMNFSPLADDGICNDLWSTNASSAFSYQSNTDNNGNPKPGSAKVSMVGAVALSLGQPWPAGTEWYSFILTILNSKTTGTGACLGCLDGVCFAFNYAQINNDASVGGTDAFLLDADPAGRAMCTWNIAANPPCTAVPVKRQTWGEVKSLYR